MGWNMNYSSLAKSAGRFAVCCFSAQRLLILMTSASLLLGAQHASGGLAAPAEIRVQDGATVIVNNTSTAIDFGSTDQGSPITREFTIFNDGDLDLTLSALVLPAGFSVDTLFTSPVETGNSTTLVIQLDADTTGTFSGQLQFTNNDPDEDPFVFPITGVVTRCTYFLLPSDNGNFAAVCL